MHSVRTAVQRLRGLLSEGGLRPQLVRGTVGSIAVKVSNLLIGFILAVFLARQLGPEGYGVYAFVLAITMLLATPAQVGLPQLVVRETAKAHATQDWGGMVGLWRWGTGYVLLFSCLLIGLGIAALWMGSEWFGEARWRTLAVGLLLVPLVALGRIRGAALRGLGRTVTGQLPERILRPAVLLILASATFQDWQLLSNAPAVVMSLHALAACFAFVVGAALLSRARPQGVRERPTPTYRPIYWRKAAIPLAALAGLQLINAHTDLIMIGILRGDYEAGVYRAVVQVAALVVFGLQAIDQVLQPHIARLHAQGDRTRLQKLVTLSARTSLLLALPPVLVAAIWGGPLLTLLFGDPYHIGALALAILALGQLVNATIGSVGMLLNTTGYERDTVRGVAIAAALNVILNLALVPAFGLPGAATATAVALVTWNLLLRIYVRKRLIIESSAIHS